MEIRRWRIRTRRSNIQRKTACGGSLNARSCFGYWPKSEVKELTHTIEIPKSPCRHAAKKATLGPP